MSKETRQDQVLRYLRDRAGEWVNGPELANEVVGGSEGLKRLRELRASGVRIEERRHPDRRRTAWQYRVPATSVPCSCGRGPVGHTTTHESTDTPGIVRIVREGKTDQYMNVRQVQAEDEARRVARIHEEARARDDAPRHDPRSHRLTFGGPVPCSRCGGTGGTVRSACLFCGGEGVR